MGKNCFAHWRPDRFRVSLLWENLVCSVNMWWARKLTGLTFLAWQWAGQREARLGETFPCWGHPLIQPPLYNSTEPRQQGNVFVIVLAEVYENALTLGLHLCDNQTFAFTCLTQMFLLVMLTAHSRMPGEWSGFILPVLKNLLSMPPKKSLQTSHK